MEVDGKKLGGWVLKREGIVMGIIEGGLGGKLGGEKGGESKGNKKGWKGKVEKDMKGKEWGNDKVESSVLVREGDCGSGGFMKVGEGELEGGYGLGGKFKKRWGVKGVDVMKKGEAFDVCGISGLRIGEGGENMN